MDIKEGAPFPEKGGTYNFEDLPMPQQFAVQVLVKEGEFCISHLHYYQDKDFILIMLIATIRIYVM